MKYYLKSKRGLTLIEVLVVMSILIFILSLGLFVTFDAYRGYIFRSERFVVISVLEKARSRAINNYHQTPWGACYDSVGNQYIIFQNSNCATGGRNEAIPASSVATTTGFSAIVFSQLSGTTTGISFKISNGISSSTISINTEGTINW